MRCAYLAYLSALVALQAVQCQAVDAVDVSERGIAKRPGVLETGVPNIQVHKEKKRHNHDHNHGNLQHKRAAPLNKKKKKKVKTMTFTSFRCQESYNGLVDDGICRTLGVPAPGLTECAVGASTWTGSMDDEKLAPFTSQGEYLSGKCAVSIYNQSKKRVRYSRATLGLWWSAATNACMWPGSGFDSAYCTVTNDQGHPTGVILALSLKDHNGDFKANFITGPTAD